MKWKITDTHILVEMCICELQIRFSNLFIYFFANFFLGVVDENSIQYPLFLFQKNLADHISTLYHLEYPSGNDQLSQDVFFFLFTLHLCKYQFFSSFEWNDGCLTVIYLLVEWGKWWNKEGKTEREREIKRNQL